MNNSKTFNLVMNAFVAAAYVIISHYLSALAFKEIQFRPAELLAVLPFFLPNLSAGVVVGCFVTNLSSPFGAIDIIFGTLSTAITVYFVARSKKLIHATLIPVICSSMVGVMIFVTNSHNTIFLLATDIIFVMASEFFTTVIIGYPLYKALESKKVFKVLLKQ